MFLFKPMILLSVLKLFEKKMHYHSWFAQKLLAYSRLVEIWMGNFNPNIWKNLAQK